ncbi:MAG TPA: short-chain dehydrogenase/reductase, partial [Castellaniella sp.]|nr:short-chain dehydrogenase/reductase [Castellaniella sp.]
MDLGLNGKTALVTGGSKGIGFHVACVLAAEGCRVHLVARSSAGLADAERRIHDELPSAFIGTHVADLGDPQGPSVLQDVLPGIDILVNNAGSIPGMRLPEAGPEQWQRAWASKVFGYIELSRLAYGHMAARHAGAIINIIGIAGERARGEYIMGCTGNAALMAFTRALGGESVDHGVRVVGVNPSLTNTDRGAAILNATSLRGYGDERHQADVLSQLPFGRMAEPTEIASVVAFLASDRASYISGTIVDVDGGSLYR